LFPSPCTFGIDPDTSDQDLDYLAFELDIVVAFNFVKTVAKRHWFRLMSDFARAILLDVTAL